ncbi:DUF3761 domain-containing protein [Streptomyces sp. NPDC101152]|uniref:DUF3761 domain-containing protein n=1 Tax=Streptomyces sp. NPDC101152 TaxID=3366116 RepID=UPI00382C7CC9
MASEPSQSELPPQPITHRARSTELVPDPAGQRHSQPTGIPLRPRLAASAVAVALAGVLFSAPAASAATLPSTNTAHHCVRHTTGVCGWTHHQKPKDKYETAKCKDASVSYSRHSQGICSRHHGVRYWFK